MDTDKFVITGRGADAEKFIGRTEAEHEALFAAVASGDRAALEVAIGASSSPRMPSTAEIYAKWNGKGARRPKAKTAPSASIAAPRPQATTAEIFKKWNGK